jgi:hypothetical protein
MMNRQSSHMHSLDDRMFPGLTRYNWPISILTTSAAFGSSEGSMVRPSNISSSKVERTPYFSKNCSKRYQRHADKKDNCTYDS